MNKNDLKPTQKDNVTYVTEEELDFILRNNFLGLGTYKVIN